MATPQITLDDALWAQQTVHALVLHQHKLTTLAAQRPIVITLNNGVACALHGGARPSTSLKVTAHNQRLKCVKEGLRWRFRNGSNRARFEGHAAERACAGGALHQTLATESVLVQTDAGTAEKLHADWAGKSLRVLTLHQFLQCEEHVFAGSSNVH